MPKPAEGPRVTMTLVSATVESVTIIGDVSEKDNLCEKGLSILRSRIPLIGGTGQHAVYIIKVRRTSYSYIIKRRFSEFVALHNFLMASFGSRLSVRLPGKTAIRYFSEKKLEDRKNALNVYLKDICNRLEYLACPEVLKFFDPQVPRVKDDQITACLRTAKEAKGRHDSDDNLVGWDNPRRQ